MNTKKTSGLHIGAMMIVVATIVQSAFLHGAVDINRSFTIYDSLDMTGSQWLYTDYKPSCTDRIEMKLRFLSTGGTSQVLYCSRGTRGDGLQDCMSAYYLADGSMRVDRKNAKQQNLFTPSLGVDYVYVADYKNLKATMSDGETETVLTSTMAAGTFTPGSVLAFFVAHLRGEALNRAVATPDTNFARFRIYYVKIYDGEGRLVRHLTPAGADDSYSDFVGTYGMYDNVTEQFLPFSGVPAAPDTGVVVKTIRKSGLPRRYRQLRYLQLTGKQWIYSGYKPTGYDTIEMKLRLNSVTGAKSQCLFCSRGNDLNGMGGDSFTAWVTSNGKFQFDRAKSSGNPSVVLDADPEVGVDYVVTMNASNCTASVSGLGTVALSSENPGYTPGSVCAFFASHLLGSNLGPSNTQLSNCGDYRVYQITIRGRYGKVVRNYIPVCDLQTQEGNLSRVSLYETITDVVWPNSGSEAFVPGPEVAKGLVILVN